MMAIPSTNNVWEYDATHPKGVDTLTGDHLKPVQSDIPVEQERRLSSTQHKYEAPQPMTTVSPEDAGQDPKTVLERRRSSVSARKPSSRKATGSFGGGEDSLKPLSGLSSEEKKSVLESQGNDPLYFSEDLPKTTSSGK